MKPFTVLGDSISTYEGYCIPEYAVYYDAYMSWHYGLKSVEDTWWMQVIRYFNGSLCINNSYSGSTVSGGRFPAACSQERLELLHFMDQRPDVILVYLGFNDFGRGVPVYSAGGSPKQLRASQGRMDLSCFLDSYRWMLQQISAKEPQARIVCGTLMKTVIEREPEWEFPNRLPSGSGDSFSEFDDYNKAIISAAQAVGCDVLQLHLQSRRYETEDGTHPTKAGHRTLAAGWIEGLRNHGPVL